MTFLEDSMPSSRRTTRREPDIDDYDEEVVGDEEDEPTDDSELHVQIAAASHRRRLGAYRAMGIGQRREAASTLFAKGYTNAEVSREMGVHPDTVTRYRAWHEQQLNAAARSNPHLLRDVLGNTLRSLEELDRVRAEAWKQYEASGLPSVKKDFLKISLQAQSERAKLFGLMGVKQDTMIYINGVKELQDKLIDFMQKELCPEDRVKLEEYLQETFADQLQDVSTPADLEQA
jgi:transposase-like protein